MAMPNDRSTELLGASSSVLLVVDVQDRLAAAIPGIDALIGTCGVLIEVAARVGVPALATEQHPQGLGPTVAALRDRLGQGIIIPKLAFSAVKESVFIERALEFHIQGRRQIVICGLEAHICVLQTAVDLLKRGFNVFVVADATGSRRQYDRDIAVQRLVAAGAQVVTADMVIYEWLERAGSNVFRGVLPLVRERG
jgi:nicotinamidase-related amidase